MMDGEMTRFIREEIKKQVNIIISGLSGNNDQFSEDLTPYPGAPSMPLRPVMHPYGLVSRAPSQTLQVVARAGDHPANRMVLGHRDANRPKLNQGEVQLYNQFGQAIYLKSGEVHIGIAGTDNPVPTGNELLAMLLEFVADYKVHQHIGNLGAPTPLMEADVVAADELKANHLDNKKIVSKYVFVDHG